MAKSTFLFMPRFCLVAAFSLSLLLFSCGPAERDAASRSSASDSIVDSANSYLNAGELSRALAYLDSGYRAMDNPGSIDCWKRLNFLHNFYLHYRVDLLRAGGYADSMAVVLEERQDLYPDAYARTIFAKGDVLRDQRRWGEAFDHYCRGRNLAKEQLDTCFWAVFTNRLGLIRYGQGQYVQAVGYFKRALLEQGHCGGTVDFELAFVLPQSIYNNIGLSYEKAGRMDSAVYFYRKGMAYVELGKKRFPDKRDYMESALGVFSGNLGGAYLKMGELALAEDFLERSIALNDRAGYAREDAMTAKRKLVQLYLSTGRLERAEGLLGEVDSCLAVVESENIGKRRLSVRLLQLRSELAERRGDFGLGLSLLKRYQRGMDSLELSEGQANGADMETAFRLAEQSHALELGRRDSQLRLLYLIGSGLLLLMVALILWVVWRNLLQSRRQVDRLEQAMRVLEQSRTENARMVRIAAHDLRNPLGAVQVLSELLLSGGELDGKGREMVEIISRSAGQSLGLVESMLHDKVGAPAERREEDLLQVLQFCVAQLRPRAAEKGVDLVLKGSPVKALVNAEQLWRVVGNLLDNALKFSPVGGMVSVGLQADGRSALVSVEDQGTGIPAELAGQLFVRPEVAGRQGTAGERSHGIGLSVAKQLIEGHGGRIWFEPGDVVGTVFFIELPLSS